LDALLCLRFGWYNFQKLCFWNKTTKPTNPVIKMCTTQTKHTSTTKQPKKPVTSDTPTNLRDHTNRQETKSFLEESLFAWPPQEANQIKPAPTGQMSPPDAAALPGPIRAGDPSQSFCEYSEVDDFVKSEDCG
jgi:hypothetical protein